MAASATPVSFQPLEISHSEVVETKKEIEAPDPFRLGCCAFRCDYLDWPTCFGCKGSAQLCCLEGDCYANQCYSDEDVCFVPQSSACDLVPFEPRCNLYEQCLCMEVSCNSAPPMGAVLRPLQDPNTKDLVIFRGYCCSIDSCFYHIPQCLQMSGKVEVCCASGKAIHLKPSYNSHPEDNPRSCCLLTKSTVVCNRRMGASWVKAIAQVLFWDRRVAFPCDEEVPCVVGDYFFTCCAGGRRMCGFCNTIGMIYGADQPQVIIQQHPGPVPGQQIIFQQEEQSEAPHSGVHVPSDVVTYATIDSCKMDIPAEQQESVEGDDKTQ